MKTNTFCQNFVFLFFHYNKQQVPANWFLVLFCWMPWFYVCIMYDEKKNRFYKMKSMFSHRYLILKFTNNRICHQKIQFCFFTGLKSLLRIKIQVLKDFYRFQGWTRSFYWFVFCCHLIVLMKKYRKYTKTTYPYYTITIVNGCHSSKLQTTRNYYSNN
jgi:hypothetical protein